MNLIVLAAGKGTRLGSLTKKLPKVLVPLGRDKTILDYHLLNADSEQGITNTIIVSGFGDVYIREFIENHPTDKRVDIVFNPFYGFSGPLGSLWMVGEKYLSEDFIICNGDTFFSSDILKQLCRINQQGYYLAVDKSADVQLDDMKVIIDEGKIEQVSKGIRPEEADAISAGMLLVKGESFRSKFTDVLYQLVHQESNLKNNVPWHQLVNELGGKVTAVDMTGYAWQEVDTPEDLESSMAMLEKKDLSMLKSEGE